MVFAASVTFGNLHSSLMTWVMLCCHARLALWIQFEPTASGKATGCVLNCDSSCLRIRFQCSSTIAHPLETLLSPLAHGSGRRFFYFSGLKCLNLGAELFVLL